MSILTGLNLNQVLRGLNVVRNFILTIRPTLYARPFTLLLLSWVTYQTDLIQVVDRKQWKILNQDSETILQRIVWLEQDSTFIVLILQCVCCGGIRLCWFCCRVAGGVLKGKCEAMRQHKMWHHSFYRNFIDNNSIILRTSCSEHRINNQRADYGRVS